VIEAQERRRQPPGADFVGKVARAEDASGEADERRQDDQEDVEVVDDDEVAARVPGEQQGDGGAERQRAGDDVQRCAQAIAGNQRQNRDCDRRNGEDRLAEETLLIEWPKGEAKPTKYWLVIDPEAPPIRPQRHVPNSIATIRLELAAAIANRLHRCPHCIRRIRASQRWNL
jgi:hypothetical protein